jgi:hypothetical protein
MSKNIETCYECNNQYCEDCAMVNQCDECGTYTCGEPPCLEECPDDCNGLICASCQTDHDCCEPEEEEEDLE